jgi:hypothetical protein
VFDTCLRCVIAAATESAALNERMTLNARERIRTTPLESPRKRVSPPVAREVRSFYSKRSDNEVTQDKLLRSSRRKDSGRPHLQARVTQSSRRIGSLSTT